MTGSSEYLVARDVSKDEVVFVKMKVVLEIRFSRDILPRGDLL